MIRITVKGVKFTWYKFTDVTDHLKVTEILALDGVRFGIMLSLNVCKEILVQLLLLRKSGNTSSERNDITKQ